MPVVASLWLASFALAAPPPLAATPSSPAQSAPARQIELSHSLVSLIEDVQVPAREAGALTSVAVSEGLYVTEGQLLAQVDDQQPRLDKMAAELERDAALAKANDDIEVRYAEAAYAVASAELERALAIERKNAGSVTQQEIQKLQLAKQRDQLQIEKSKLDMRVAKMTAGVHQAAVSSADNAVARRKIVSPLNGLVVTIFHEKGEWVAAGEPVLQVVRIDRLRAEGFLSATEVSPDEVVGRAVQVEVQLAGGRSAAFAGKVVFISPLVQAGDKYRVRAEVDNRTENGTPLLRPGMTATMKIALTGNPQPTRSLR
jgi:multidrug efflux pump subunit AcrA (membrane-fusion protein)